MPRIKISFKKFSGFFLILILSLNFSNITVAQPDYTTAYSCGTTDSMVTDPYNGGPKTGIVKMVVVYFDFPNGRLEPGSRIPLTTEQIDS